LTYFTTFELPADAGFRLLAGRPQGLHRLLVATGQLPAGLPVHMHLHVGDEVIRILSGELTMRVGDERRTCRDGDVIIVPPNVLHGFRVVADTVVEVVAEHDIGTFYPVRQADGTRRLVEVFTPLPWDAPPPRPGEHTTDEEVQEIVRAVDIEV
jgi:quercetin dioxygenase-like cupin family protein